MAHSDLKVRTKDYALSVIRLFAELPQRTETQIMGRQLLRSDTSVGAQYRDASRAKSNDGNPLDDILQMAAKALR